MKAQSVRMTDIQIDEAAKQDREKLEALGKIESPFAACVGNLLVDSEKYKKNKAEWDKLLATGKVKGPIELVQSTHFYKGYKGAKPARKGEMTPNQLLDAAGKRSAKDLDQGIQPVADILGYCDLSDAKRQGSDRNLMGTEYPKPDKGKCAQLKATFLAPLLDKTVMSTYKRSLGQIAEPDPKVEARGLMDGNATLYMNLGLKVGNALIGASRPPVLDGEDLEYVKERVTNNYNRARAEFRQEVDRYLSAGQKAGRLRSDAEVAAERKRMTDVEKERTFVHGAMLKYATEATGDYYNVLGKYPQLGYVTDYNLPDAELNKALRAMLANAAEVRRKTNDRLRERKLPLESEELDTELLPLIGHTATVERMLRDEAVAAGKGGKPANCSVATSLFNELKDSKMASGLKTMGGIVGTSVALPLLGPRMASLVGATLSAERAGNLVLALGFGSGAYMGAEGILTGEEAERRVQAGVSKFEDTKEEVLGMYTSFTNLQVAGSKLVAGTMLGLAGREMAIRAAKGMASKEGMQAAEKGFVEAMKAGDQKKGLASIVDSVKRLLGRAPDSIDDAFVKGTNAQDMAAVEEYLTETKGMTTEQRKDFVNQVLALYRKAADSGGVASDASESLAAARSVELVTREKSVAKAAMRFARAGVNNVDEVSKLLQDKQWTKEALDGVSAVLRQSEKDIKAQVAKGVPAAQARAEAVTDSISTIKYGKPYKELDETQKVDVQSMCVCATMCPLRTTTSSDTKEIEWNNPAKPLVFAACVSSN